LSAAAFHLLANQHHMTQLHRCTDTSCILLYNTNPLSVALHSTHTHTRTPTQLDRQQILLPSDVRLNVTC